MGSSSMANKLATKPQLLGQWKCIEEEKNEDGDNIDALKSHRLHQHKEQWSSPFPFHLLITLFYTHVLCLETTLSVHWHFEF